MSGSSTSIYEKLGVRTLINAAGTMTRLGGIRMRPEAVAAMVEASRSLVRIDELQAAAGAIIAKHTGAEAGYVTCGAAAGLTLATAACLAGYDPAIMDRLPDTRQIPNEVVIARSHRSGYDHAIRAAGARLVEVGLPDPNPWEIEAAISPRTVAVAFSAGFSGLSLPMVAEVAHGHNLPVIVDAAAELPPFTNLRGLIDQGADLVVFSGGKAIRGPQASGILCGRRDLIASAALQNWDLDVHWALFDPPGGLIDRGKLKGVPHHGIGRGFKVGKEEIAGLIAALEAFASTDPAVYMREAEAMMRGVAERLSGLSGVEVAYTTEAKNGVPMVSLTWLGPEAGLRSTAVAQLLKDGHPSIHLRESFANVGRLSIHPTCLEPTEAEIVASRLTELIPSR